MVQIQDHLLSALLGMGSTNTLSPALLPAEFPDWAPYRYPVYMGVHLKSSVGVAYWDIPRSTSTPTTGD